MTSTMAGTGLLTAGSWRWPLSGRLPLAGNPAVGWAAWLNPSNRRRRHQTDSGCAAGRRISPQSVAAQSGWSGSADLVYRSPTANFASYNKVMLDPVAIWARRTFD